MFFLLAFGGVRVVVGRMPTAVGELALKWPLCLKGHLFFRDCAQHHYLWCPPGDPHVEGIVAADLGVSQTPALLVGIHEGGLLVGQHVANDHGGASN